MVRFCFLLFSPLLFSFDQPLPEKKLYRLEARSIKASFKTAIIIPCHWNHFKFLFPLLEDHCNQSILPDEIVISLSEADKVLDSDLTSLKNHPWPFELNLICTNEKKSAGENRQIASDASSSDLLICIDADDLPHNQRIEIIKEIFENYCVDVLYHCFYKEDISFTPRNKKARYIHRYQDLLQNITLGHVCYLKQVCQKVQWPNQLRGEDTIFVEKLLEKIDKVACLLVPLTFYRLEHSSWINRKEFFTEEEIKHIYSLNLFPPTLSNQ